MPNLDWSQCPAVESIPGKVSGAWVFKGTRMPVQTVFANFEAGMSLQEITEVFDGARQEESRTHRTCSLDKEPSYALPKAGPGANISAASQSPQVALRNPKVKN